MADYILIKGERLELVESDPGEGQTTYAEHQLPTPAEAAVIEAQRKDEKAEELADRLATGQAADFALARMIFEILKAQKTSDWSYFDTITNTASYKRFLRELIRSRL